MLLAVLSQLAMTLKTGSLSPFTRLLDYPTKEHRHDVIGTSSLTTLLARDPYNITRCHLCATLIDALAVPLQNLSMSHFDPHCWFITC
jgi:hypothetical protein